MPLSSYVGTSISRSVYPNYWKTHVKTLASDVTSSGSASFATVGAGVDPMTLSITTDSPILLITLDATFGLGTGAAYMRLLLDGVAVKTSGGHFTYKNYIAPCFTYRAAVAPGSHTVTMEWLNSGATMVCRPASFDYYHASIVVQEVWV